MMTNKIDRIFEQRKLLEDAGRSREEIIEYYQIRHDNAAKRLKNERTINPNSEIVSQLEQTVWALFCALMSVKSE